MWKGIVVFCLLWGMSVTPAEAAPYVSCIDGHIVASLDHCPTVKRPSADNPKPYGGGGGRSGLLGLGIGGIL